MNYQRVKQKLIVPLLVLPTVMATGSSLAQDTVIDTSILDRASEAIEINFQEAAQSHQQIIELSDQADELISQYDQVSSNVDSLQVYNAGLRRTIDEQERTIEELNEAIANIAALQRQIPPLMERMMIALEQFVELDVPFQLDTRRQRLELIRDTFDDSGVNIAERFRQVLLAYQAETNYGRSIAYYADTLEVNGVERDVDMLRVGRIALLYQTSDQTSTGMYDREAEQFVELGDEYRRPVSQAIRMAQGLTQQDMIELPIPAPEAAQ